MSDDEEKKPKTPTVAIVLAAFAAITAVGDGVRSCNEREADRDKAEREAVNRVTVDKSIQAEVLAEFDEVHEILEEQDRAIFELEVRLEHSMPTATLAADAPPDAHDEPDLVPIAIEPPPAPKKRKRRRLEFAEPEPAYDIREQLQQRAVPALPPLPPKPNLAD